MLRNLLSRVVDSFSPDQSKNGKRKASHHRGLHLESLEERELLSVSLAEFHQLRMLYSDLNLSENITDHNVIDLNQAQFTAASLQNAINVAAQTAKSDLIVVRTSDTQNTITLDGNPLLVDIDANRFGSVAIVGRSLSGSSYHVPLVINSQEMPQAFSVSDNSKMVTANVVFAASHHDDDDDAYTSTKCVGCVASSELAGNHEAPDHTLLDLAPLEDTFKLHSNPGAKYTIYLDFTGHVTTGTGWNGDDMSIITRPFSIDNDYDNFSTQELLQIQRAWAIMSEDFLPFNINVTTEDPGDINALKAAGLFYGIRVAIGYVEGATMGGVAFYNSFNAGTDLPCFVYQGAGFSGNFQEAATHEVGHALNLSHDGRELPIFEDPEEVEEPSPYPIGFEHEEYYGGHNGWAAIMGASYYYELTQWSKGEYRLANNQQDDLRIITTTNGGVTYREDDHGNTVGTASDLYRIINTGVRTGIIERNTDFDVFWFVATTASIDFAIQGIADHPNLDIKAELLGSDGKVIYTSNPQDSLNAEIKYASLIIGSTYYVRISGTGKGGVVEEDRVGVPYYYYPGYSDYGSLGAYTIYAYAIPLDDTFKLHSNSGSQYTIYLDFKNERIVTPSPFYWSNNVNSGAAIVTPAFDFDGDPTTFSEAELRAIQRAWAIVSEDFLPFDVNVTTEDPGDAALTNGRSIRVAIGGSCFDWYKTSGESGVGGVAHVGSFGTMSINNPTFVFSQAGFSGNFQEAITHEVGHTLGLRHDGQVAHDGTGAIEYYGGHNNWGPIMGSTYGVAISQWSRGEYIYANNKEDDLNIIVTQNGFGYRIDDHGNFVENATDLLSVIDNARTGIIERNTDVDVFWFVTTTGLVNFSIRGITERSNLDIKAELIREDGIVVYTSNPNDSMNAEIVITTEYALPPGLYYIRISGVGRGNPLTDGYSNYGSLGAYTIIDRLCADKYEDNNTVEDSTNLGKIIGLQDIGRLSIHHPLDVDWFRFEIVDTGTIEHYVYIVFANAIANGNLDIYLYREGDTTRPLDFSNGRRYEEAISLAGLEAGVYYLKVKGHSGATSAYTLKINAPIVKLKAPVFNDPTGITTSGVTVSWNEVANATGYVLEYARDAAFATGIGTRTITSGSTTSIALTGLTANTTYYIRIRATAEGYTDSPYSELLEIKTLANTALPTPTLNAPTNVTTTGMSLSWGKITGATGYSIQYATNAAFTSATTVAIDSGDATAHNLTGLTANTTYYIRILATASVPANNSAHSLVRSATTLTIPVPPPTPLTAPTLNAPANVTGTGMTLTWNAITNATGYTIQYATNSTFTEGLLTRMIGSGSTLTTDLTGLAPGTTYYIRIKATGTGTYTDSLYSTTQNARTLTIKLATPTLYTSPDYITDTSIGIGWQVIANASGYSVQYATNDTFTENLLTRTITPGSTQFVNLTGLTADTTYYIRIMATGTGGYTNSDYSTPIERKTLAEAAGALPLTVDTISNITSTTMTVAWTPAENAAGYKVQYSTNAEFKSGVVSKTVANIISYTVTGLTAGKTYYIRVVATNAKGGLIDSASAVYTGQIASFAATSFVSVASPITTLAKPVVAKVTVDPVSTDTATGMTVTWKAVPNAGSYLVEYSTSSNFKTGVLSVTVEGDTATLTNLLANKTYYVRITVVGADSSAYGNSAISATKAAVTSKIQLATPTNLAVETASASSIKVTWDKVASASSYTVQYSTDPNFAAKSIKSKTVAATLDTTTITGLSANTTYYVRVVAVGRTNYVNSVASAFDSSKTLLAQPVLKATAATNGVVNLSWGATKVSTGDIATYTVEYSTDKNFSTSESVTTDSLSCSLDSLEVGMNYYIRITVMSSSSSTQTNVSSWSLAKVLKTK